jgi:hypothetical protein
LMDLPGFFDVVLCGDLSDTANLLRPPEADGPGSRGTAPR